MKLRAIRKSNLFWILIIGISIVLIPFLHTRFIKIGHGEPAMASRLISWISIYQKENGDYPRFSQLVPLFADHLAKVGVTMEVVGDNTIVLRKRRLSVKFEYHYEPKDQHPKIRYKEVEKPWYRVVTDFYLLKV